jgi:hypothetical protein
MGKKDILVLVVSLLLVVFIRYNRYVKNKKAKGGSTSSDSKFKGFSSSSTVNDDYEPYSKK